MMEAASLAERIEKCERILKENSKSQVFAALADAYRCKGDLDQAFRICRQGIRVHPNYGPGHLVMAKISFERKMFDWAEQELQEAVTLDGETRATQQLKVEIQIAKGNYPEAENTIKKLKATGVNPFMIQELQQRLERQKKEERRRRFDQPPVPVQTSLANGDANSTQPVSIAAKPRVMTMSQAMDKLMEFKGVHSVLCANHDGTVIDTRGESDREYSEVAAFCVEMRRNAESEAAIECLGGLNQIWIESQDRIILIVKLARFGIMATCEKDVNSGSMRLLLEEIIERLQDN